MELYLDENFRVRTVPYNFILEERVEKLVEASEGCEEDCDCICELETLDSWVFKGYYSKLNSLLHGYLHDNIMRQGVEELEEILRAIEHVEEIIENLPKIIGELRP